MLVVTDVSKLPQYGFKEVYRNIYELVLRGNDDATMSILIDNSIVYFYTSIEQRVPNSFFYFDKVTSNLDILYKMIKDGIIVTKI